MKLISKKNLMYGIGIVPKDTPFDARDEDAAGLLQLDHVSECSEDSAEVFEPKFGSPPVEIDPFQSFEELTKGVREEPESASDDAEESNGSEDEQESAGQESDSDADDAPVYRGGGWWSWRGESWRKADLIEAGALTERGRPDELHRASRP